MRTGWAIKRHENDNERSENFVISFNGRARDLEAANARKNTFENSQPQTAAKHGTGNIR